MLLRHQFSIGGVREHATLLKPPRISSLISPLTYRAEKERREEAECSRKALAIHREETFASVSATGANELFYKNTSKEGLSQQ